MNQLKQEKRELILTLLTEGNSLRAITRITGVSKVTTIKLIRDVGKRCEEELDRRLRNIRSERIQADELYSFLHTRKINLTPAERAGEWGDVYVFVAIDADTKLVPCYEVGKRNEIYARAFIEKLRKRVVGNFQLTTDAFVAYNAAISIDLVRRITYAQLIKSFRKSGGDKREGYSPSVFVRIKPSVVYGNPDPKHISTSYIERQNLTLRMECRRFARLTNAISKKMDCHKAAIAMHYFKYNFIRGHQSLDGRTPAMAAGLTTEPLTWAEVLN